MGEIMQGSDGGRHYPISGKDGNKEAFDKAQGKQETVDKPCQHNNCTELENRYWWCKDCGALRDNEYDWRHPENYFKFGQPSPTTGKWIERHAGDCTIYRSIQNNHITDGICTCGFGWDYLREHDGDPQHMYSRERLGSGIESTATKTDAKGSTDSESKLLEALKQVTREWEPWEMTNVAKRAIEEYEDK